MEKTIRIEDNSGMSPSKKKPKPYKEHRCSFTIHGDYIIEGRFFPANSFCENKPYFLFCIMPIEQFDEKQTYEKRYSLPDTILIMSDTEGFSHLPYQQQLDETYRVARKILADL
jgi:hypothetical protein